MPVSPLYQPDPQHQRLGPEFADPVRAADFPETILRFRNDRAAATVGLDTLTDAEWIAHFGRFEPLPGNLETPLAMRYHGHQFRVYNPDIGDGRGFLFAQLREAGSGRLLDLGTKGSGPTPYSRTAPFRVRRPSPKREWGVWPEPLVPRSSNRPVPASRSWANRNPRPSPRSGL